MSVRVVFTVPTIALGEGARYGFAHKGNAPGQPIRLPLPCSCCGVRTPWFLDAAAGLGRPGEVPLCEGCIYAGCVLGEIEDSRSSSR